MENSRNILAALMGLALACFSHSSIAANATVVATVDKLINQDGGNGRCVVRIAADLTEKGLNCNPSSFVSLACDGAAGNDKQAALRNWDIATLALVTGQPVKLRVYDNITVDGYCYSPRADLDAR